MSSARQKIAVARAVHNEAPNGVGRNSAIKMSRPTSLLAAAIAAMMPTTALAGSDTDTFEVTATVLASCEVSASDLVFGNYDPIAASNLDADATLSITCTNGTPYHVGLGLGNGSGASLATRQMTRDGDTATLGYALYQDDQRSVLWGETGGDRLAGTGAGTTQSIDVYGRAPMQQSAPAGNYADTIVVTVTW
jgi:spore coat protein U-like protein